MQLLICLHNNSLLQPLGFFNTKLSTTMAAPVDGSSDHLFTFPRGDVDIKVTYKDREIKGKVNGQALIMASPVWQKFVSPPWKTVGEPKITAIDFSGDDGAALLILLRISHLQLFHIPKIVDLMTAYNIAVLCEQYDCVHLLSPWIEEWLKALKSSREHSSIHAAQERKAYIYWAFGDLREFRSSALSMVKNTRMLPLSQNELSLCRDILPERLYENIKTIRESTLQKLLNLPYTEIDKYFRNFVCPMVRPPICEVSNRSCDIHVYGSLTLELGGLGLWPQKSAKAVWESVQFVENYLTQFSIPRFPQQSHELDDHEACGGMSYDHDVSNIMSNIEDPTEECHIRHMKLRKGATIPEGNTSSTYLQCVRCNTSHSTAQECPPNPRKRPAE
ncbi:hypothetical protein VTL71DRAFT_13226 [Oculimacula yallundae]|uniref:BTB domain-containing protein n=1 Tax=Oculimacula yallundae TaxID=86028 RepID=A0ABR4CJQ9_9HELO